MSYHRHSLLDAVTSADPRTRQVEEAENWTTSVPSSVLDSLSKDEIHYQNLVHELIKGEVLYLQDLDLIETVGSEKYASLHR